MQRRPAAQAQTPPQPSAPQASPRSPPPQCGMQPHSPGTPAPPHVCPPGHPPANVPHTSGAPQPLSMVPQFKAAGQIVIGVHVVAHVPLEQTMLIEHTPQIRLLPQPSGTVPQVRVPHAAAAVFGVHPQALAIPPPPHVAGGVQTPLLQCPPHPSESPHARFVHMGTQAASGGGVTTSGCGIVASGLPLLGGPSVPGDASRPASALPPDPGVVVSRAASEPDGGRASAVPPSALPTPAAPPSAASRVAPPDEPVDPSLLPPCAVPPP